MRRFLPLFLAAAFFGPVLFAQQITHGPVTGGLTHTSARVYLRTSAPIPFTLELATDAAFANIVQSIFDSTRWDKDRSRIVDVGGLQADTRYHVRFRIGNQLDSRQGSFTTAPLPGQAGNYVFVTGSCQETPNMKTFALMPSHRPRMLLHTGDYTYPSYQIGFQTYPREWSAVELSWRRRYQEVNMDTMLFNLPIDYVPDDDDLFGESRELRHDLYSYMSGGQTFNVITTDTITPLERRNTWRGYSEFFPGYPLPDTTQGLYHDFTFGNCRFFYTDARSTTDNPVSALRYDPTGNQWFFEPDSSHTILGQPQMDWLLNGLSQSSADWNFIVCGMPFNPAYRRLMDVGLMLQGTIFNVAGETGTGLRLTIAFGHYWAGFPHDVDRLLGHIRQNNIRNCIFITGDTHHNVIDDGTNSRLPELNASGLSVTSTELAYQIDQYAQLLGEPSVRDSLWNVGGNGLGNQNFKNGFGKIEVFGADSVRLCVIDEDNEVLACHTVLPGYTVLGNHPSEPAVTTQGLLEVFPNPASDLLTISPEAALRQVTWRRAYLMDPSGRIVQELVPGALQANLRLSVGHLPAGMYFLVVDTDRFRTGCPWIKQ
jgi:phosphodiesterase/alkaline phosphatase D-like protein